MKEKDTLDIYEILDFILSKKLTLTAILILPIFISVISSYFYEEKYTGEIIISQAAELNNTSQNIGGISSILGLQFDPKSQNSVRNLALLKSRAFLIDFIKKYELKKYIFKHRWDDETNLWVDDNEPLDIAAYKAFLGKNLGVVENKTNGLITLTIMHSNPEVAAFLTNAIVNDINQFIREKDSKEFQENISFLLEELENVSSQFSKDYLYKILEMQTTKFMNASVNQEYAFVIVDPALVPNKKSFPSRVNFLITGIMIGISTCILYLISLAFFNGFRRFKKRGNN